MPLSPTIDFLLGPSDLPPELLELFSDVAKDAMPFPKSDHPEDEAGEVPAHFGT